jgi:hypothetical protein
MKRILPTSVLVAAIGLPASASPALSAGSTLSLSGPASGAVGRPMAFNASGNDPFDPNYAPSFALSVGVISPRVVPACPADKGEAIQLASSTGGDVPVFTQQEVIDWNGDFSTSFGYTPRQAGTWLLCAYTADLTGSTLAAASQTLDIQAAARRTGPAAYTREGVRSCHALLAGRDARSCDRHIVRKANAACHRLPSRHGRAQCLRAVRRAARTRS